jgi:hypothetical protein
LAENVEAAKSVTRSAKAKALCNQSCWRQGSASPLTSTT